MANGKFSLAIAYESNVLIKQLMLPSKTWDILKLGELFLPYEVEAIKKTRFLDEIQKMQDIENSR